MVNNNNVLHSFPVPRDSTNTIAVMVSLDKDTASLLKFRMFGLAKVILSKDDLKTFSEKAAVKI